MQDPDSKQSYVSNANVLMEISTSNEFNIKTEVTHADGLEIASLTRESEEFKRIIESRDFELAVRAMRALVYRTQALVRMFPKRPSEKLDWASSVFGFKLPIASYDDDVECRINYEPSQEDHVETRYVVTIEPKNLIVCHSAGETWIRASKAMDLSTVQCVSATSNMTKHELMALVKHLAVGGNMESVVELCTPKSGHHTVTLFAFGSREDSASVLGNLLELPPTQTLGRLETLCDDVSGFYDAAVRFINSQVFLNEIITSCFVSEREDESGLGEIAGKPLVLLSAFIFPEARGLHVNLINRGLNGWQVEFIIDCVERRVVGFQGSENIVVVEKMNRALNETGNLPGVIHVCCGVLMQ